MYSLSRNNLLPRILSWTHPKFKTPWIAIFLFSAPALPLLLIKVDVLAGIYAFGALIAYILINLSFIALKNAKYDTMYRVPFVVHIKFRNNGYKLPLTGAIGFVACVFSLFAVVLPQFITLIVGVSWLTIGLAIYYLNGKYSKPYAIPEEESLTVSSIDRQEKTILIAFKLKPHERHIIDIAADLAKEYKCGVTILHVIETPMIMPIWEKLTEEMTLEKKREMETLEEWLKGTGIDVNIEFHPARDAVSGIIDYINTHNVQVVILGELEGKTSPTVEQIRVSVNVPILTVRNVVVSQNQ
jgi:APA family basic amino acid/polyamine antiporter